MTDDRTQDQQQQPAEPTGEISEDSLESVSGGLPSFVWPPFGPTLPTFPTLPNPILTTHPTEVTGH